MLVVPVGVAVAGALAALALNRLAVWSDTAVLLHWAGPLFQGALALALAMSMWGYRRLRRGRSGTVRGAWQLL